MMSSGNFSALRRSTLLRLSTRSRSGAARVAATRSGARAAAALAGAACVWAAVLSSARHPHVSHMLVPPYPVAQLRAVLMAPEVHARRHLAWTSGCPVSPLGTAVA